MSGARDVLAAIDEVIAAPAVEEAMAAVRLGLDGQTVAWDDDEDDDVWQLLDAMRWSPEKAAAAAEDDLAARLLSPGRASQPVPHTSMRFGQMVPDVDHLAALRAAGEPLTGPEQEALDAHDARKTKAEAEVAWLSTFVCASENATSRVYPRSDSAEHAVARVVDPWPDVTAGPGSLSPAYARREVTWTAPGDVGASPGQRGRVDMDTVRQHLQGVRYGDIIRITREGIVAVLRDDGDATTEPA